MSQIYIYNHYLDLYFRNMYVILDSNQREYRDIVCTWNRRTNDVLGSQNFYIHFKRVSNQNKVNFLYMEGNSFIGKMIYYLNNKKITCEIIAIGKNFNCIFL